MIGIIGAMQVEIDEIVAELKNKNEVNVGAYTFVTGEFCGKSVVVCKCGVGKVFSSSAAALAIREFGADTIINVGVAGGKKPLRRGDVVVASKTVQHDYDATPDGLPLGCVHGFDSPYFACDEGLCKKIDEIMNDLGIAHQVGVIASGDCFVGSKQKSEWISERFGAIAYDMESAAINQICAFQGVKFAAIRAISDNGDDEAITSFYEFVDAAAKTAVVVLRRLIEEL